jgi:hypothetical protein
MRMCGSAGSLFAAWLFVRAVPRTWKWSGKNELSVDGSTNDRVVTVSQEVLLSGF